MSVLWLGGLEEEEQREVSPFLRFRFACFCTPPQVLVEERTSSVRSLASGTFHIFLFIPLFSCFRGIDIRRFSHALSYAILSSLTSSS